MNVKLLKEIDEIVYAVCAICRNHEKTSIVKGIKVGVWLSDEVNTP